MLDPKLGGVVEFRLSESGIRLQGACQLKFPTWNSEIPTSQYKSNAALVLPEQISQINDSGSRSHIPPF